MNYIIVISSKSLLSGVFHDVCLSESHVRILSALRMTTGATPELITGPGYYRSSKSAGFSHLEVSFNSTLRKITYSSFPSFVQMLV